MLYDPTIQQADKNEQYRPFFHINIIGEEVGGGVMLPELVT